MRRIFAIFAGVFLALAPAHAHRQPEMVSTVNLATLDDGRLVTQITHRIHAHDAMHILGGWNDVGTANLDDAALLDRLSLTLMDTLSMSIDGGLIGYEVDRNYLYVYEEVAGHADLLGATGLSMISDLWTHRVDLSSNNGPIKSHTFSEDRGTTVSARTAAP